jgi:hypothetical protein
MNDDPGLIPPTHPPDIPTTTPAMEVHHHAPHHGKRSVSSYFWEFLMLFLAVFCGFLAEYKLEHIIEHQREKTFMHSLVEDLEADEKILMTYHGWRQEVNSDFDSILLHLADVNPNQHAFTIYTKAKGTMLRFGLPDINEGTIQQLKAGGLRLVRQREVVNSINNYYMQVTRMRASYETERLIRVNLVEAGADVLAAPLLLDTSQDPASYRLMTTDKMEINQYMHQIMAARILNKNLMTQLDSVRETGVRLRGLIKDKY